MIHPAYYVLSDSSSLYKGKGFGPRPSFGQSDIFRLLWNVKKRAGRQRLARALGVGEGSARTMIESLRKKGLVDCAPMGVKLTEKGAKVAGKIDAGIGEEGWVAAGKLSYGKKAYGIRLKKKISKVIGLRDYAIRVGAEGATFLEAKNGKWILPGWGASTYVAELEKMGKRFEPNGMLAIIFGKEEKETERAAWATALRAAGIISG
ncbi:Uncharacterised protein [Candidatus Gugararchaeum adminiculabundum]|nr:Uncharacterised protein [Candidatus Gugararchaeum adminiculabundum]